MASGRVDASVVVENVGAGRMSARILHHPPLPALDRSSHCGAPEISGSGCALRLDAALLLALCLLRLAQPEYWVLKSYLKVVQPYLDAVSCAQLNMFSTARAPEGF